MRHHPLRVATLALIAALLAPLPLRAGDGDKLFWFQAQEEYRGRFTTGYQDPALYTDEEADHDLRLYLAGGVRDAADRFYGNLSLGAWFDVDGQRPSLAPAALGSLYDLDSSVWFDVFSLYGEYHSTGFMRLARLGRQTAEYGLPATFDGAHVELRATAPAPYLDLFLYGGRTVHFFEADADLFEDWVAAAGAVVRPMERLRLVLDYRFTMEDTNVTEGLKDHTYGLEALYAPLDWLSVKAYGRGISDAFSHAGGAARFAWYPLGLGLDLKVDSQLAELREVNELDNPYYAILGASMPHTRWGADLWKSFDTGAGTYGLHLGWTGRANHEDESTFNRNYGKLYCLFEARDIGVKGPFLSLSVENHFADVTPTFDEEGVLTAGGSAGYQDKLMKAEAGTYYQRFKYDYYADVQEYENVRTFYGAFTFKPLDWLGIRAHYAYEQLDRDIHTVLFTLSQSY
jgi:hypothetical protein